MRVSNMIKIIMKMVIIISIFNDATDGLEIDVARGLETRAR